MSDIRGVLDANLLASGLVSPNGLGNDAPKVGTRRASQPTAGDAVTSATMSSRTQTISVPDWSTSW